MALKFPLCVWAGGGEKAHLVSSTVFTKDGAEWLHCSFVLSTGTREKHKLGTEYGNKLIDYENHEYPEGLYYHDFKRSHVIPLNPQDPSDPVILIWNKFDGTMVNPKSELFMLSEIVMNADLVEKENVTLKGRITSLQNQLMAISSEYALYKKRYGSTISPELEEIGKLIAGFQKFTRGGSTQ